jgi:hypothetical protein
MGFQVFGSTFLKLRSINKKETFERSIFKEKKPHSNATSKKEKK